MEDDFYVNKNNTHPNITVCTAKSMIINIVDNKVIEQISLMEATDSSVKTCHELGCANLIPTFNKH